MTGLFLVSAWAAAGCGDVSPEPDVVDPDVADQDVGAPDADAPDIVEDSVASLEPAQAFLPVAPQGMTWRLAWHDEFDGDVIDESKWTIGGGTEAAPQARRDGWWVGEAMRLDGEGHLQMLTYEKDGKIFDGVIDTGGKFEHTFGYYEARMDVNKVDGHWGAFWLMGGDWGDTGMDEGAVDGVEIDVMERPWSSAETGMLTNHAIHWDGYVDGANASMVSSTDGIMVGFHTFGLWWSQDMYRFYIDGGLVWETSAGGICNVPIPIILSDETGANIFFLSNPIDVSQLPDRTLVDYVRVWDLVAG